MSRATVKLLLVDQDECLLLLRSTDPSTGRTQWYPVGGGEARTLTGARWWRADELAATADTVFPPDLGIRLAALLAEGPPVTPIDISDPTAP